MNAFWCVHRRTADERRGVNRFQKSRNGEKNRWRRSRRVCRKEIVWASIQHLALPHSFFFWFTFGCVSAFRRSDGCQCELLLLMVMKWNDVQFVRRRRCRSEWLQRFCGRLARWTKVFSLSLSAGCDSSKYACLTLAGRSGSRDRFMNRECTCSIFPLQIPRTYPSNDRSSDTVWRRRNAALVRFELSEPLTIADFDTSTFCFSFLFNLKPEKRVFGVLVFVLRSLQPFYYFSKYSCDAMA